jgi:hypothetical protein
MSLDVATWVTAIATVVLAVFAIVTAWYARKAFRKQAQEVSDQAGLLKTQSDQLEEQRKINAKQTVVLELQEEDLRESLTERKRERQAAERQQANGIGFRLTSTPFPDLGKYSSEFTVRPGEPVRMAIVSNQSRRPIKNVVCRIGFPSDPARFLDGTPPDDIKLAVLVGRLAAPDASGDRAPDTVVQPVPLSDWSPVHPGEQYGFVFGVSPLKVLMQEATVRFTDDAGLHWQIDLDQHLEQLPDRDW